jgi:aldehyde:ferredoxin oxidoreductase
MDRTDADQEGITLSPQFTAKLIAEAAARKEILEHIGLCPFASSKIDERIRTLETSFARLTGFMLGSGILGGAAGAAVSKLLSP